MPRGGNQTTRHQALLKAVQDYLTVGCRAYYLKLHGGTFGRAGLPDVLAILPDPGGGVGRAVACEIKTGMARLSFAQEVERHRIQEAGGLYVVVREIEMLETALLDVGLLTMPLLTPARRAVPAEVD